MSAWKKPLELWDGLLCPGVSKWVACVWGHKWGHVPCGGISGAWVTVVWLQFFFKTARPPARVVAAARPPALPQPAPAGVARPRTPCHVGDGGPQDHLRWSEGHDPVCRQLDSLSSLRLRNAEFWDHCFPSMLYLNPPRLALKISLYLCQRKK